MATTRIIGVGFNIKSVSTDTITFRSPVNIDGFGGTAETHLANITDATAKLMSNIVTNSNGLMTACDVPTRVADWPDALTERFCVTQSATIATYTSGDLAESAAVDGDVCMMTPRNSSHGDWIAYDNEFNTAFNTTKNITFRCWSPVLKCYHVTVANRVLNNATGVSLEDFIMTINALSVKQTATLRRCYLYRGNNLQAGAGGVSGSVETHSCIGENTGNTLFKTGVSGSSNDNYHFAFASSDFGVVADISSGSSAIIANGIFILKDNTTNPFIGAGDFTGTTNNWTNFNSSLPGSGNLTNRNVDELKLAMFNGPSPSSFLWPVATPEISSNSTTIGAGITIAAAHTLIENRRDFQGNLRPTAGLQDLGAFNSQTHDGGVAWVGYKAPDISVTFEVPISVTTDLVVG